MHRAGCFKKNQYFSNSRRRTMVRRLLCWMNYYLCQLHTMKLSC